jgi:hypothetical protein
VLTVGADRYQVGEAGDQIAIGRWTCGQPQLALLRPGGRVYVFDAWADRTRDVTGRLAARVAGATWLLTEGGDSPRCDRLVAGGGADGPTVVTSNGGP